jgi:hypothetical protein
MADHDVPNKSRCAIPSTRGVDASLQEHVVIIRMIRGNDQDLADTGARDRGTA